MASENIYYEWLIDATCNRNTKKDYSIVLRKLFDTEFYAVMEIDDNRIGDALSLRDRFHYETGLYFDSDMPCTVLEIMVSLSFKCEEMMEDGETESQLYRWFFDMIVSLGLDKYPDKLINETRVDTILENFIAREYGREGDGGLFYLPDCPNNMREAEIWYQMCWYLNTIIE